jgi:hypothetical protein
MDGKLTDWAGKVRHVEVATGPSTRHFALPDPGPGPDDLWRLSYEDTDDGRTFGPGQSTSKSSHPPWVFRSARPCVTRDGALRVGTRAAMGPETPIAW